MQVVHRTAAGETTVLADQIRLADGFIAKTRGLMGRSPLQPGEAMVFPFDQVGRRQIHTMFVFAAIDVLWIEAERVRAKTTFSPWSLGEAHPADTVIELPADTARGVEVGDIITLVSETAMN